MIIVPVLTTIHKQLDSLPRLDNQITYMVNETALPLYRNAILFRQHKHIPIRILSGRTTNPRSLQPNLGSRINIMNILLDFLQHRFSTNTHDNLFFNHNEIIFILLYPYEINNDSFPQLQRIIGTNRNVKYFDLNILIFFDPPSAGIVLLRCLSAILFGASSLSPSEDCLQSSQTPSLKLQNE